MLAYVKIGACVPNRNVTLIQKLSHTQHYPSNNNLTYPTIQLFALIRNTELQMAKIAHHNFQPITQGAALPHKHIKPHTTHHRYSQFYTHTLMSTEEN